MKRLLRLFFLIVCVLGSSTAVAQHVRMTPGTLDDPLKLSGVMPALARQAISTYAEPDRMRYLTSLFQLQLAAGDYARARTTIRSLQALSKQRHAAHAEVLNEEYDIYASAKLAASQDRVPFAYAFGRAFRKAFATLSDTDAQRVAGGLALTPDQVKGDLESELDRLKDKTALDPDDVAQLAAAYVPYALATDVAAFAPSLVRTDADRRYDIDENVLIKTGDGATISAIVVRKKGSIRRRPAALVFTIYAEPVGDVRRTEYAAARGYVGVTAYTRGKAHSPDAIVPYEDDGRDATAVIDWIAKQRWSNGKVGMYGGSYNGFTQWAAAKYMHPALKTIVPYVANNPGNGLPMENNVFLFVNYAWAFYTTDNRYLDDKLYNDPRWRALNDKWYASGRPYRDIDAIDGKPNPWFHRWLQHPGYDAYWRAMVPYGREFAKITIPVLTITGYFDDGQGSALNFFKDHYRYNPRANHYLLIGPYDHFGSQRSHKPEVLRGYAIDPVAQIDTPEITFEWLDYVLRGGKKPALLADRVNYEVMGDDVWRHAPSLDRMSRTALRLYVTTQKTNAAYYRLDAKRPSRAGALVQRVDFADRKTTNNDYYPYLIIGKKPDPTGFTFITAPFQRPVTISGLFRGRIKAAINKRDIDLGATLYEVMPDGRLFELSYFIGRASYARDMSARRLLSPGKVETIDFDRTRMVSRRLAKGSRLLFELNVNKNQYAQINYGTGKDVSGEDIRDAKVPLVVKWLTGSYIDVPISYE